MYAVETIEAATIVTVIKDLMTRMNLPIAKLRGQCYDGASVMSGMKTGVAKQIHVSDLEPRAIYARHGYGHAL